MISKIRKDILLAMLILGTGSLCHADLNISEGPVFRVNGSLVIFCWTDAFINMKNVLFLFGHFNETKEEGPSNYQKEVNTLYYKYFVSNAQEQDAGTYFCQLKDNPSVVSTTATAVAVNDDPRVGIMNTDLKISLLTNPVDNVLCYLLQDNASPVEVDKCTYSIKVTESTIRNYNFVVISKTALLNYGVERAIEKEVTFNICIDVIGLEMRKEGNGVFVMGLMGNQTITENMYVTCIGSTTSSSVRPGYSVVNHTDTYECQETDLTAEVYWKGRSVRSFTLTQGAAQVTHAGLGWILLGLCVCYLSI